MSKNKTKEEELFIESKKVDQMAIIFDDSIEYINQLDKLEDNNPELFVIARELPRILNKTLESYMIETGSPCKIVLPLMLSIMSAAAQANYDVQFGRIKIPVSLYTIVLGPAGIGKSRAFRRIMKPIYEHKVKLLNEFQEQMKVYERNIFLWGVEKENLERKIKSAKAKDESISKLMEDWDILNLQKPQVPTFRDPMGDDFTAAAFKRSLEGDGASVSIMTDEAKVVFESNLINDGLSTLLAAHSGIDEPRTINRVYEKILISNARVSICLCSQESVIKEEFKKKNIDPRASGLYSRFLFSSTKGSYATSGLNLSSDGENNCRKFERTVVKLLNQITEKDIYGRIKRKTLFFKEDAAEYLYQIREWIKTDPRYDGLGEFTVRSFDHVLRIAALIHLFSRKNEKDLQISKASVEAAYIIILLFMGELINVFHDLCPSDYARMGRWFKEQFTHFTSITKSFVAQRCLNYLRNEPERRSKAIELLIADRVIRCDISTGKTVYYPDVNLAKFSHSQEYIDSQSISNLAKEETEFDLWIDEEDQKEKEKLEIWAKANEAAENKMREINERKKELGYI